MHDLEDIKGVAPNPDVLTSIGKKLTLLREEAGDYLEEQGMAFLDHLIGERIMIQNNGGILTILKSFALPTGTSLG